MLELIKCLWFVFQALNGQNIYNGCCTLRIDYSKLQSLNVRYNNDKSRDFTNPTLPNNEGLGLQQMDAGPFGLGGLQGMPGQWSSLELE